MSIHHSYRNLYNGKILKIFDLLCPPNQPQQAGLQDEDHLTAVVQHAKLAATGKAFALWCFGGDKVVTWGSPQGGGDKSSIQQELKGVQQIQGTWHAFAAILEGGSVVTWGQPDYGGNSSKVQDQLKNIRQIQATSNAFAAITTDGSVVTWGDPHWGGDSSAVQSRLRKVRDVQATHRAFAAILSDGSVVTWGHPYDPWIFS